LANFGFVFRRLVVNAVLSGGFMVVVLITGGARSGKSRHAEARARSFPGRPAYIATAEAFDAEMEERIARHRARRGNDWFERETPLDLVQALTETDGGGAGRRSKPRSTSPSACAGMRSTDGPSWSTA
jgi:Cobinamide kinase / cobinamide phosphate guanyltransferase